MNPTVTEAMARAAHDAWYAEKRQRLEALGLPLTWPSESGEEQLVPWDQLSEAVREFDTIVLRAALSAVPQVALDENALIELELLRRNQDEHTPGPWIQRSFDMLGSAQANARRVEALETALDKIRLAASDQLESIGTTRKGFTTLVYETANEVLQAKQEMCGEKNLPGSHACNAPKGHEPGPEEGGHYCRYAWSQK